MIRIVCMSVQLGPEGQTLGHDYKSFDVNLADLQKWLASANTYEGRSVVGVEILPDPKIQEEGHHG